MKIIFYSILSLLSVPFLSAQPTNNDNIKVYDCQEISDKLTQISSQLENLNQRELYYESNGLLNTNEQALINERRQEAVAMHQKYTLIKQHNCNPKASKEDNIQTSNSTKPEVKTTYTTTEPATSLKSEKIKISQKDFDGLSAERQQKILNSLNLYEIVE